MKFIKLVTFIVIFLLSSCSSVPVEKVNFEQSISYRLHFETKEIKKSGDFLVIDGKNKEKVVISENFLDEVLNQISPPITSKEFFDLVYEGEYSPKVPTQVTDFRNGFIDEKVTKKHKLKKENSIVYLWEMGEAKFKAIELANKNNYFLNILGMNCDFNDFLLK